MNKFLFSDLKLIIIVILLFYSPVEKKPSQKSVSGDIEVSRGMFDDLRAMVVENHDQQVADDKALKEKASALGDRMSDAEAQIELLKKMGAPTGDGDSGAGLLDALNDITDKLSKDLMDKIDDLTARVEALETETKAVDEDEQR